MSEFKVNRSSKQRERTHRYETSAPNEYPKGCVPEETGYGAKDISSGGFLRDHNRITVCRPNRG